MFAKRASGKCRFTHSQKKKRIYKLTIKLYCYFFIIAHIFFKYHNICHICFESHLKKFVDFFENPLYNKSMDTNITKLENYRKFNTFPFHIDIISPTKKVDTHYHDCIEMIFVKNGTVITHIDSFPFLLERGNLFLISYPVSHSMFDFKDFSAYRLLFDMSIFDEFDEELKSSTAFHSLFVMSHLPPINDRYHSIMGASKKYLDRLVVLCDELISAYEEGGVLAESYIKRLFYAFASLLIDQYNEKSQNRPYYIPLFHVFIENITEHINISELADRFGLSRGHFHHLFTKYYGQSPKQLIQDIRMRNAKTLLTLTDKSITEIASSCGVNDPVYFAKIFKAAEGVSPSQYRKLQKREDV